MGFRKDFTKMIIFELKLEGKELYLTQLEIAGRNKLKDKDN